MIFEVKYFISVILILVLSICVNGFSQSFDIPKNRIMTDDELFSVLKSNNFEITAIKEKSSHGDKSEALKELTEYFREKFAERYFFSWKNFSSRLKEYSDKFPSEKHSHIKAAEEQMAAYPAKVKWKLPFKNLKYHTVTSYELRHLTRQNKAVDLAFTYSYTNEDTTYKNYFVNQVLSLDKALEEKKYDNAGNGVYESFRAGYRMFNWLFAHNVFLASKKYNWHNQIILIKTFLQTGAELYSGTKKFSFGNHQTKGLSSLFQIAAMFPEIKGTDEWLNHAESLLEQHLNNEVNIDGFQFERSVHYHIGDIDNYFYVYQLAKINHINLPNEFVNKLKGMFEALTKISQPDGTLPVLQDDTDNPLAEYNDMKNVMTLGAILFDNLSFRYFSEDDITEDKYWLIKQSDANIIYEKKGTEPKYSSTSLPETGYYIMRNGWKTNSEYMILSAGLSKEKPDHQHGDMLGLVAYANGNAILPNYQVRYFLPDFNFFKNSWTKSVALVDSIPQGKYWKPNSGGTGFGKWSVLPKPKTIQWYKSNHFDYYSGTHNAYDSIGVKYFREVYFFKSGFWIVRDNFISNDEHSYQQVWQGHYSAVKNGIHLRSSFRNGSGLDIVQLNNSHSLIFKDSFQGKGNSLFQTKHKGNFSYITLLYPFSGFGERMEASENDSLKIKNYLLIDNPKNKNVVVDEIKSNAKYILKIYDNDLILFTVNTITIKDSNIKFSGEPSFELQKNNSGYSLTFLGFDDCSIEKSDFLNMKVVDHNLESSSNQKIKISPGTEIILN